MNKLKHFQNVLFVIMRITAMQLLIMVIITNFVAASALKGQAILNRTISIEANNESIKSILNEIESQASVNFTYQAKLFKHYDKISLSVKNETLDNVLATIFNSDIEFVAMDSEAEIVIRQREVVAAVTTNTEVKIAFAVSGKVKDENGQPLPGVNVIEKGTTNGTATDADGKYSISVPNGNAILVFTFIGYTAQEAAVNNREVIDISMDADIQALGEVVVVGYGTQERKDISSAIGSVKGSELTTMAVTGADQAMQGKLAGVNVTSNDGTPGGSTKVTIRGIGSLNNTNPLYVIDGVMSRQGLTNIAANDIESIDVLKDASAAAIYGLQGANGVVIVTTKRGKGGKPRLTFDMYTGQSKVSREIDLLSPRQYAEWNNESTNLTNAWRTSTGRTDLIPLNPDWAKPDTISSGTDWQKEVFRTAKMEDYQIGFSGGNDKTNYSVSFGYRNQQGVIPRSEYKRYNTRINVDHRATDFLKVGASLSYTHNRTRGVDTNNLGGGVVQYTMLYSPLLPVFQPGYPGQYSTIPSESQDPNNKYWYAYVPNPFSVFDYTDQKNDANNLYASVYGEVKLPFGITYKSQIGLYTYDGASYSWTRKVETPWDPAGNNRGRSSNGVGVGGWNGHGYNWDNTLNYVKQIGDHSINVTAGMVAQLEYNYNGSYTSQTDFVSEAVPYLGYGDPTTTVVTPTSISEVSLFGILGRVVYGYKDKYLLTANVRRDQSSRFAKELNSAVFPSASVAWRISEEGFMKSISFISDLKIRAGWGKIGNQNGIPAYPTYNLLGSGNDYNINGTLVSGVAATGLGNSKVTWESTQSSNIGLDASVLSGALSFTADYYIKDNSQILLQLPIVATGGVGIYPTDVPGPAQNVGRIRNSGLELSATYRKQIADFNFSISGNGTWNKNEILDLGGSDFLLPPNTINQIGQYVSRFAVGHSIGAFYGYQVEGIYQNQSQVDADNAKALAADADRPYFQQQYTSPGDYKFKDVNGDGHINEDDRTFIGNPNPKFSYGFSLNASYKNFDFSAFFQGIAGVDMFNALAYRTEGSYFQPFNRTQRAYEERWTGEGTSNTFPRIIYDDPNANTRVSSRYIDNGAYMRLRNLQIGYSLPQTLISKLKMTKLRFYVAGQNLITITKYNGLDPETGVGQREGNPDSNYDLGIDRGQYPQPKTVMIGLNASF